MLIHSRYKPFVDPNQIIDIDLIESIEYKFTQSLNIRATQLNRYYISKATISYLNLYGYRIINTNCGLLLEW